MSREWSISFKFNVPDSFSKMTFGLGITVLLFCLFPVKLGSETLTLTTYYPAPYGGYASILTTGRTLLARDGDSVGIGPSDFTLPAPNGLAGNLYVNDIFLRARSDWVSRLPLSRIDKRGSSTVLSCEPNETLVAGGCDAGWRFQWGPWSIDIPRVTLGWCPLCISFGPYHLFTLELTWGIVLGCGTDPQPNNMTMNFFYSTIAPSNTWITCVKNKP